MNGLRADRIRRYYVDGLYGQVGVSAIGSRHGRTPLVLFHATALSSDLFREFMQEMGRDRLVIGLDTPGYGRSDPPPNPVSIADYARSHAAVLDALGIGEADMLGYHTGTYIAAELAILRPDLVRRLVLPGIPFFTGEKREEYLKTDGQIKPLTDDFSPVREKWDFWVKGRAEGVTLEQGQAHFYDEMQSGYRSNWAYRSVFTYKAEDRLPLVTQPVLVPNPHGSLKYVSRKAANLMPNAQVLELPDMDVGIFDLHVPRLAQMTRDFLD